MNQPNPVFKILSAISLVAVFTLVAHAFSLVRELLLAQNFGTSDQLDAFLIAMAIPIFATNVFGGSVGSSFMPTYIQIFKEDGRQNADELFGSLICYGLALLVSFCLLLLLSQSLALVPLTLHFSSEKTLLVQKLFAFLVSFIAINSGSQVFRSYLNAHDNYRWPALSPGLIPLGVSLALLLAPHNIWSVLWGTIGGALFELIILLFFSFRSGFAIKHLNWRMTPQLKMVVRQYLPMIAGSLLMSGTLLIDQSMAAWLPPGSVAQLNYGNRLVSFLTGFGGLVLGTAILPTFSRLVAERQMDQMLATLRVFLGIVFAISLVATLAFCFYSREIIQLVFERGAFTPEDTLEVSQIQFNYLLQTPFYLMGILLVRTLSALKRNSAMMWGAGISLFLNVVCNYYFMNIMGVKGIALSTSVVYFVSFHFLMGYLIWSLKTHK